jgi:hypothetical protein
MLPHIYNRLQSCTEMCGDCTGVVQNCAEAVQNCAGGVWNCTGVVWNLMGVVRNRMGVVQHCMEVVSSMYQMLPKATGYEQRLRKCASYVWSALHCVQQGQPCQWCNNYKTLDLYLQVSISIPAVRAFGGYPCGILVLGGNLTSEKYIGHPLRGSIP